MNARLSLVCGAAAVLAIAACSGSKEDPSGSAAPPPPPASTPAPTTSTLVLTVEGPQPKAGIEAHVKAEVDGRSDGITGAALAVTGAGASLQTPTGWETKKGDVTVVTSTDKKSQIGASSGGEAKLGAAVAAMGLTACEWNPSDRLTIGKNALSGTGADGKCMRGSTPVVAAFVAPTAEGLLVVGAWEAGGDMANVFGSMRAIAKAAGGGGGGGIGPCCAALHQNANSAPPDQKPMYMQAAAICDGLKNNPQASAMMGQVRAALRSANMPSSCR